MNAVALSEVIKSVLEIMPNTNKEFLYKGAKEMLLVDDQDFYKRSSGDGFGIACGKKKKIDKSC